MKASICGSKSWSIVEAIEDHRINDDGSMSFLIKWQGWKKKSDKTWEPEKQLREDVPEILNRYIENLGRAPKGRKASRVEMKLRHRVTLSGSRVKASRRSRLNDARLLSPISSNTETAWKPPRGSWEEEIQTVDACDRDENGEVFVYLTWKNGHKTKHATAVVYKKCPQKAGDPANLVSKTQYLTEIDPQVLRLLHQI